MVDFRTYCIDKEKVKFRHLNINHGIFDRFYEIKNPENRQCIGIPDGSIDLQCFWKDGNLKAYVAGSFTQGGVSPVTEQDKVFGARFKVGKLPEMFGYSGDLINNRIDAEDIMDTSFLNDIVSEKGNLTDNAVSFMQHFKTVPDLEESVIVQFLIDKIDKNLGFVSVQSLIDELGYSHRYTDQVFKSKTGLTIKKYASIVRLQNSLDYLMNDDIECVYEELGFYDQAHFIKDFKRFTTFTPNKFSKRVNEFAVV